MDHDEPGFWEMNGYNNHGDPWKEERYWARLMESPVPPVEQRVPGRWQIGTVSEIKVETPRVKSFRIEPADVDAAPARVSTTTSASPPRTATAPSAPTRSPPRRWTRAGSS